MYIINNGIFLDSWNKTIKLLDILLIDSCPECLHTSFLHDIVKISYNQEPKMKVNEALLIWHGDSKEEIVEFEEFLDM
jgi:hypothetical protein